MVVISTKCSRIITSKNITVMKKYKNFIMTQTKTDKFAFMYFVCTATNAHWNHYKKI